MSSTDGGNKADSPGSVPTIIVRGGTTTSRYDRDIGRRRADANRRRGVQDSMYQRSAAARSRGECARIGERKLVDESSPRLVLHYMNRDKTVRQSAVCEITADPTVPHEKMGKSLMFTMVCPRCMARGLPMEEAQMLVREQHRPWTLHSEADRAQGFPGAGDVVMVEWGWGNRDPVMVAGTVSCHDIIRCDNTNCDYAVNIDHSRVFER